MPMQFESKNLPVSSKSPIPVESVFTKNAISKATTKTTTKPTTIITAVQLNSQQNIDVNLTIASKAIADAKLQEASLVVLPENVCSMGRQRQTAERFDELSNYFSALACKHQLYLVAGTLPCPYRPNGDKISEGKLRQVSLLFAPDGTQKARYDKIHLFRALVNDNHGSYDEGLTFEAGTELVSTSIELGNKIGDQAGSQMYNLGMMICFDLRFPKMAQKLRQMGADIITAPSAFTYQTGEANWSLLLQARALDSQCFLVGAGQGGDHHYINSDGNGSIRQTWGHSGIASENGQMLAQLDSHQISSHQNNNHQINSCGYELISANFDIEKQNAERVHLPIFNCHRLV